MKKAALESKVYFLPIRSAVKPAPNGATSAPMATKDPTQDNSLVVIGRPMGLTGPEEERKAACEDGHPNAVPTATLEILTEHNNSRTLLITLLGNEWSLIVLLYLNLPPETDDIPFPPPSQ